MAIDRHVCFYRRLFADLVKQSWCITRPVGPLGSTNQNWLGARLLLLAVLIYPVVCVHSCFLLRAQHHCLWPSFKEGSPSACLPTPTTTRPLLLTYSLISTIHDITGVVKNYLKNQKWIMHDRVSYKTVAAILIRQILRGYNAAQENHSCFNAFGISWNTKCDIMAGFPWSCHICTFTSENLMVKELIIHI